MESTDLTDFSPTENTSPTDVLASESDDATSELLAVKLRRCFSDPVILYRPGIGYGPNTDHDIYDAITIARLEQTLATPVETRIELATWPELTAYAMAATCDAGICLNEGFVEMYQYAAGKTVSDYLDVPIDGIPDELHQTALTGRAERLATDLRQKIKASRDSAFVSSTYDEFGIDSIPKSFWTSHAGVSADTSAETDTAATDTTETAATLTDTSLMDF